MTPAAAAEARERTLRVTELLDAWPVLSAEERLEGLRLLPHADAEDLLLSLPARDQAELILETSAGERRSWMRLLPPDDAADVVQAAPEAEREGLLALLDDPTRKEVAALLAYAEDDAGGLMNPRYARLRPDMSVDEAITYLRRQARERLETIYYMYVLDAEQRLLGVVSFRDLFAAPPEKKVRDIMHTEVVTAPESMDQEALSRLFAEHDFLAIPVIDAERHVKGIVTVDDIVDVVQEEATEDIQKIGGMEALDAPYLEIGFASILAWHLLFHTYGDHYVPIALTVAMSLIGVVTWGTIAGSMLPLVLRRIGFDPASASAPFVATLVDVSGLVIYFSVASLILRGTLL